MNISAGCITLVIFKKESDVNYFLIHSMAFHLPIVSAVQWFLKKNQNISESSNLKYNNQEWYTHPKLLAFQVEYTPCKSDKVHEDLYTKETCMSETVAIS